MKANRTPGSFARALQALLPVLLSLLLLRLAIAQEPQTVRVQEIRNADISLSLTWWPDNTAEANIAQVAEHPERFSPITRQTLVQGHSRATHWLRLTLVNNAPGPSRHVMVIGNPRLESVTLYQPTPYGWHSQESGSAVPLANKPLRTTDAAFPVELAPGEHQTVYLRVRSATVINLQTRLWIPADYLENREERHLLLLLVTGFSFLVATGSVIAYRYLRDRAFLFFAGLHLSISLLDLARDGLIQRWFWPSDTPFLIQTIPITAVSALTFMILLQRRLMPMAKALPKMDRLTLWLAVLGIAIIPVSFVDYALALQSMTPLLLVYVLFSLVVLFLLWRQGIPLSLPMLLAFLTLCVLETTRQLVYARVLVLPNFDSMIVSWPVLISSPFFVKALVERKQDLRLQLAVEKEVSQAKSLLLAHVSHDLRAPVNIILGYARLLQRTPESPTAIEVVRDIERNAHRLMHLIDDLIDQSRIEFRTLRLSPSQIEFGCWLDELERSSQLICTAHGNQFVLHQAGELPEFIRADGARLHQVLDNLITNANNHTQAGKITLKVSAMTDAIDPRVRFEVADTGTGIASEDLPHLFEAFRRGPSEDSPSDSRPGLGLGLSIASNLVQIMGGELDVQSQPGRGSRFSFSIPCTDTRS